MKAMTARTVAWGRHRIRLMPGWTAAFRHTGDDTDSAVVADERARRRDGRGPAELQHIRQPCGSDGKIPDAAPGDHVTRLDGRFDLYQEGIDTPEQAAFAVAAAQLACTFHEVIEWTLLDGRRLADPHPTDDEQWEWVSNRMHELLTDYAALWPPKEST